MKPMGISAYELARRLRVPAPRVNDIVCWSDEASAQTRPFAFRVFSEPRISFGSIFSRHTKLAA